MTENANRLLSIERVRFFAGLALLAVAQPILLTVLMVAESRPLGLTAGLLAMLAWMMMVTHIAGVRLI